MSAIDSHEHANVGIFFTIPVYWLLETTQMSDIAHISDNKEVMIDSGYFSIGGGSGEHPALMINLDAVILKFMDNIKEDCGENNQPIFDLVGRVSDRYIEKNLELYRWSLDLNQWPLETFVRFNDEYREFYKDYPDFTDKRELETKMMDSLALFIIYEMPFKYCLKDPELVEFCRIIASGKWNNIFKEDISDISMFHAGIKKPEHPAGKVTRHGKTVWRYSLEDWMQENNATLLADKLELEVLSKTDKPKMKI